MKYKLIAFDLDGTLIDSAQDIANAANFTREQMGLEALPVSQIRHYVGRGVRRLLQDVFASEDEQVLNQALTLFFQYYDQHLLDHTVLYPGVRELLDQLAKNNCILGVLSNKPQKFSEKILAGLQLSPLFRYVLGGDLPFGRKPDPSGLHWMMDKGNVRAEEMCFVGDSLVDWETGKNAGVFTAILSQGFVDHDQLAAVSCDLLIRTIEELKSHLLLS